MVIIKSPSIIFIFEEPALAVVFYFKTYTRAPPYLLGAILGLKYKEFLKNKDFIGM